MNSPFENTSPRLVTQAILNIALRYKVIKKSPLSQGSYIDSYQTFHCVNCIDSMLQLIPSIESGSGQATWVEYYKLWKHFIEGLANVKGMSVEAVQDVVATEVRKLQEHQEVTEIKAIVQQKEMEHLLKFILYGLAGVTALGILIFMINSITQTVQQHFLNTQEVERLQQENQQLHQENDILKSELEKFKQFQQERNSLDKLKAENEALRRKNSDLNDRLIQCKKPFWNRNCQ